MYKLFFFYFLKISYNIKVGWNSTLNLQWDDSAFPSERTKVSCDASRACILGDIDLPPALVHPHINPSPHRRQKVSVGRSPCDAGGGGGLSFLPLRDLEARGQPLVGGAGSRGAPSGGCAQIRWCGFTMVEEGLDRGFLDLDPE